MPDVEDKKVFALVPGKYDAFKGFVSAFLSFLLIMQSTVGVFAVVMPSQTAYAEEIAEEEVVEEEPEEEVLAEEIEAESDPHFAFEIYTPSAGQTFAFQVDDAEDFEIDWGTGMGFNSVPDGSDLRSFYYSSSGTYIVRMRGEASRISFYEGTPHLLSDVIYPLSPGVTGITSTENMFRNATNIDSFSSAHFFDHASENVTNMANMFRGASSFNQDIGGWDTSSVTNMANMFNGATSFDQSVGGWDVSNVTDMTGMFSGVTLSTDNYDSLLVGWTNLPYVQPNVTFDGGSSKYSLGLPEQRRQYLESAYGWTITDGGQQLPEAFAFEIETTSNHQIFSFQVDDSVGFEIDWGDGEGFVEVPDGSSLHVNKYVTAGTYIIRVRGTAGRISFFEGTPALLRDILAPVSAGVSGITSAENMFRNATAITSFTASDFFDDVVGNVTDMSGMFRGATSFNQDISGWNVSGVNSMNRMFFGASAFNRNIGGWNVSSVTDMSGMFTNATAFNQDISGWVVSNVTDMSNMFQNATSFNQNIGGWNVSSVADMSGMFRSALSFNQNIDGWTVSNVSDMSYMFYGASAFNQNLNGWNVSSVNNMFRMFYYATSFNGDVSDWVVSNVTDMTEMFGGASAFNQDISGWNVENVTNMSSMFRRASAFNQDIGTWDVSSVLNMSGMFQGASAFNRNIGAWGDKVGNVTNMSGMFNGASAFNQDLSAWDVSSVTTMYLMFNNATSFDQNIGGWDVSNVSSMWYMFNGAQLSTSNYDSLLVGWSELPSLQLNVIFHGGDSVHSTGYPADRKEYIEDTYNWTIYSAGEYDPDYFAFEIETTYPFESFAFLADNNEDFYVDWGEGDGFVSVPDGTDILSYDYEYPGTYIVRVKGQADRISFGDGPGASAYFMETFTEVGEHSWMAPNGVEFVEVLVVAGGGGGGGGDSHNPGTGGGGGGGLIYLETHPVNPGQQISVVVGDGGSGGQGGASSTTGENGEDSVFDHLVAVGGGGGARYKNVGESGGSGGGGGGRDSTPGGAGIPGQGHDGGTSRSGDIPGQSAGGGGGGAGSPGGDGNTSSHGGDGGEGLMYFGSYYAAGGGGGGTNLGGSGGSGIGGDGALGTGSPTSGQTNTGSGGGGAHGGQQDGGDGGSGIVIISYEVPAVAENQVRDVLTPVSSGVTGITSAKNMFKGSVNAVSFTARDFFDDISGNVTNMSGMFHGATLFNQDLSNWDTSNVTDMSDMFNGASSFNGDIETWDVSSVTDMSGMFQDAPSFNRDISGWIVGNVINMADMFKNADSFNRDISGWNVSSVINMAGMFAYTSLFNQSLSGWNVSNVTDMSQMFRGTSSFNQPLSDWNFSNVENMSGMFMGASAFNQNIGGWDVSSVTDMSSMFAGTSLSTHNYDELLIGWSYLPLQSNVYFHAGTSIYNTGVPAQRKQHIISTFGWTITDGGHTGEEYNLPPDDPEDLGPEEHVDGSWITNNTPTLAFSLSDPNSGDFVRYRIQISDSDIGYERFQFIDCLLCFRFDYSRCDVLYYRAD